MPQHKWDDIKRALHNRAVQLIACDSHAQLVSKAGSVIGYSAAIMNAILPSLSVNYGSVF